MTLTVTHTSPIASVGTSAAQTGNAVSGQKPSDAFGSLLATLFGIAEQITDQTALAIGTPSEAANALAQPDQAIGADGKAITDLSGLDISALLALVDPSKKPSADGENPDAVATPQQLIAALVKVLQGLEGSVDTAQLTKAGKALDAIGKLLTAAPATGTTPEAQATSGAQASVQADALAKLAEKFSQQAPELSTKLSQLADKLATSASATAQDADVQQALQVLFGEKQVVGKAANTPLNNTLPTGADKGLDQSAASATSPIDATKLDLNATKTLSQTSAQPAPETTTPAASKTVLAGMAAAANGATPTAKSETAPQSDALLLAQSNNQHGIKTDIAAAVKPMTAAYQPATQNLNLPHIAFEIARNHQDGMSRFQIRLDPPEMGRIDVKLNVDGAGNLHARMTVERADTLDLLQRDARSLERALQQAGIENGRTNLEFSLRQNPFARQDGQSQNGQANGEHFSLNETETAAIPDIPAAIYYRGTASPGGINMFA